MPYEVNGVVAAGKGAPVSVQKIIVPDPGPGEAVVRVQACGVCHTDLHYREGGINDEFPFLLGHEASGIVEAVGAGVTNVAPGDFVILNWRAVCGDCRACRRGKPWYCFNTFNAEPADDAGRRHAAVATRWASGRSWRRRWCMPASARRWTAGSARTVAGLLGCGVMAGMGAAINTGGVSRGDTVAVIGCGGVGSAAVAGARLAGARRSSRSTSTTRKLESASELGATAHGQRPRAPMRSRRSRS